MFQDEARFGRMSRPFYAWAPYPLRPLVDVAIVREFQYVYGAVSPSDGECVFMRSDKMNTDHMGEHLNMISTAHPDELVLLVVDNASSHKAKGLDIPANVRLCPLPPYSPELNPQEQVWKKMRSFFANRIFSTMEKCVEHIDHGIARLGQTAEEVAKLTNWPWIKVSS